MKQKCPFCNRKFTRSSRELLSNQFCNKCIGKRIEASGGVKNNSNSFVFKEKDSSGYGYFIPIS